MRTGSVVEAITPKGMSKILITYIDKTRFTGYELTRHQGILGSEITGEPDSLFEPIPDQYGVIIASADNDQFGIYIYRDGAEFFVYHRDNGDLIDKVTTPEKALKVASHKLLEYADQAEYDPDTNWSKTREQGKKLNTEVNLAFLKSQLGF